MLELKSIISKQMEKQNSMASSLRMALIHLKRPPTFWNSLRDYEIPIVLTGAMRSSNEIGSDGVYNLMSAGQGRRR